MDSGNSMQAIEASDSEDTASLEEIACLCESRAATYALLSRLFRTEVDEATLETLSNTRFPADTGNAYANKGIRLLAYYLSNAYDDVLEELSVDYTRTFLGHGMDTYSSAYPYESVYTSKKRLLMQDAYVDVLARYRSQGIVRNEDCNEMEDHIALELEFMQVLAQRTAAELRANDEGKASETLSLQQDFIHSHLENWTGFFASDMRTFSKTDFYQGLSYYLEGSLQIDAQFLDNMLLEDDEL